MPKGLDAGRRHALAAWPAMVSQGNASRKAKMPDDGKKNLYLFFTFF
jgi:hypothetical protein